MTARKPLLKRLLGPPYRYFREKLWPMHPRRFWALARWSYEAARAVSRRRRERRLTVAVDIAPLWEPLTGIGWYLLRLLQQLAPRNDLVLRLYGPSLADGEAAPPAVVALPEGPAIEQVLYPTPENAAFHRDRLIRLVRRFERWLIAADGNRVLFAPNYLPSARFAAATGALVATVHDLGYRRVPWAIRRETLDRLEAELDETWFRARRIVTDSRAIRDEIVADGLASPGRIRVIPLGPGQMPNRPLGATLRRPAGVAPGYVLSVGTLEPRKNLDTLLEAWRTLRRRRPGGVPPLVLCGGFGWKSESLRVRIDAARAEGWLHHLGYVDEGSLPSLYQGARMFVFPSRYEGFGLPVLEALAAGVPVVASDIPVIRELAGEAALYASPRDMGAWVEAIESVLDDQELGRRLAAAGSERAKEYAWERAAELHVQVFREAAFAEDILVREGVLVAQPSGASPTGIGSRPQPGQGGSPGDGPGGEHGATSST